MDNLNFLTKKAHQIRSELFEKFVELNTGHPGSTMSIVEVAVALYYGGYIRKPEDGNIDNTDKLIVSKGHASMIHYPILADLGFLPKDEWELWAKQKTSLRVFANTSIKGITATMGSLGHGIGVGAGLALSYKRRGIDRNVFVIFSEGELYEGSTWEAMLFAAQHKLDNLKIILDQNKLIVLGKTEDLVALEPIDRKIESFGIPAQRRNGHDFSDLSAGLDELMDHRDGPSCMIIKTVKGKGFSIMENEPSWHYWNTLTPEQLERCRMEIAE